MDPEFYSQPKPKAGTEGLSLWDNLEPPSPAEYAEPAANTDDGEALLDMAERAANAILDAQGTMAVWEVRVALAKIGKLANDGTETLDGLGALGTRMHLVPVGADRPDKESAKWLPKSHLNRNTRWARPGSPEATRKSA